MGDSCSIGRTVLVCSLAAMGGGFAAVLHACSVCYLERWSTTDGEMVQEMERDTQRETEKFNEMERCYAIYMESCVDFYWIAV